MTQLPFLTVTFYELKFDIFVHFVVFALLSIDLKLFAIAVNAILSDASRKQSVNSIENVVKL